MSERPNTAAHLRIAAAQMLRARISAGILSPRKIMTTPSISSLNTALKSKIEGRQAKIAVIGMGYVGLPLALLYTEQKFQVTGFDIDQRKVDTYPLYARQKNPVSPTDREECWAVLRCPMASATEILTVHKAAL